MYALRMRCIRSQYTKQRQAPAFISSVAADVGRRGELLSTSPNHRRWVQKIDVLREERGDARP